MKQIMLALFGLMAMATAELSAQNACCQPKIDCKPQACCPADLSCCTTTTTTNAKSDKNIQYIGAMTREDKDEKPPNKQAISTGVEQIAVKQKEQQLIQ